MVKEGIYEKAKWLLDKNSTLALSINDEYGYPKIYAMEKVLAKNLEKIVFITKKDSNKVHLLDLNDKCCVEVHTEDDMICLRGHMEVKNSEEEKRKILPKDYMQRLERSGSNKYCVLIFHTLSADLYIDGNLESVLVE